MGIKHPQGIKVLLSDLQALSQELSGETWKISRETDEWQQTGWLVEKVHAIQLPRQKRLPGRTWLIG